MNENKNFSSRYLLFVKRIENIPGLLVELIAGVRHKHTTRSCSHALPQMYNASIIFNSAQGNCPFVPFHAYDGSEKSLNREATSKPVICIMI